MNLRSRHVRSAHGLYGAALLWSAASFFGLFLAVLLPFCNALDAQQPKAGEYEVKSAYLLNFGRFVEWPGQPAPAENQPFAVCVLGKDPFGKTLDATLAGESIEGQSLVAKRLSKPEDATGCRVLFISASEDARLRETLAALDKSNILTVSDIPRFAQRGGMIEFVMDGAKVRFEVNVTNASDAGLVLSSDLLKVAVAIRKNAPAGS
jgi:hypothetical protein